jgi:hypothetical protein
MIIAATAAQIHRFERSAERGADQHEQKQRLAVDDAEKVRRREHGCVDGHADGLLVRQVETRQPVEQRQRCGERQPTDQDACEIEVLLCAAHDAAERPHQLRIDRKEGEVVAPALDVLVAARGDAVVPPGVPSRETIPEGICLLETVKPWFW